MLWREREAWLGRLLTLLVTARRQQELLAEGMLELQQRQAVLEQQLLEVRQQLATTQGSLSHANTDNRNLKEENMVDLNTIIIR